MSEVTLETPIYFGQFGEYTITDRDRREVIFYRSTLTIAAVCFAIGSGLALWQGANPIVQQAIALLYGGFCLSLGVSLFFIHIYMAPLHRLLQVFWLVGTVAAVDMAWQQSEPLVAYIYNHPQSLWAIGFLFAALTGIYFKEAFCFDRLETKFLTPLVPLLLVGHLTGLMPVVGEQILLAVWAILFLVFAARKWQQDLSADIGDKSVFEYLRGEREESVTSFRIGE